MADTKQSVNVLIAALVIGGAEIADRIKYRRRGKGPIRPRVRRP